MYNKWIHKAKNLFSEEAKKKVKSFVRSAMLQDTRSIYKNMFYFYKAVINTLKV